MTCELPVPSRVYLLEHLGSIEHRLSLGASERIQTSALLATFKIGVEIAAKNQ